MKNTSSPSQVAQERTLEIAGQAITALTNPAIDGSEYWNLTEAMQGSAGFRAAWTYATGAGVTVGLVDEGVNYRHLDLAGHYDTSIDFDPEDTIGNYDARPDSSSETHGTEVAGVIAGDARNSFGTIGAAPDATITASYLRYGTQFSLETIGTILGHQANYDVSNNSWGFTAAFADNFTSSAFNPMVQGLEDAVTAGRHGLGTAMVFAAGNGKVDIDGENIGDDSNFHSLSNNRFVIAVGAHDSEGDAAIFSSPGANVLLSAPGVGLLTTEGQSNNAKSSGYVSGTSFAAPMVSSAIALMLEANPHLGYRDIQEILAISSDSSTAKTAVENGAGTVNGGGLVFDREMGFGKLSASAAVSLARSWTAVSTAANEDHIAAHFTTPEVSDPQSQSLSVEVVKPADGKFSLDFVQLHLSVTDADLADLKIELTSAQGTTVVIAPNLEAAGGRTSLDFDFSSVATWGEDPYGTWTVTLSHPHASSDFHVLAADLDFYGDNTNANDTYYITQTFARQVAHDASRADIADTDGGIDLLNLAAASKGATIDLSGHTGSAIGTTALTLGHGIENVYGTVQDDEIRGSSAANRLSGDYGNDLLIGGAGDDTLRGGFGNDTFIGGAGADNIRGGWGHDVVRYTHGVTLDFKHHIFTGDAAGDVLSGINSFLLSRKGDVFVAAGTQNLRIDGGGGRDALTGNSANNVLIGGRGVDTLAGGRGDDRYYVDSRGDQVIEHAHQGNDQVTSSVSYRLGANIEGLKLTGNAVFGFGNAGANIMTGTSGHNVLLGDRGNDKLSAGGGDDRADGGSGKDTLSGGNGNDKLVGGRGADLVTGGHGEDTFIYTSRGDSTVADHDVITDFRPRHDRIDLQLVDANTHHAGNDRFTFIGDARFGGHEGELRARVVNHHTLILGDVNGDGATDFEIVLKGAHHLGSGDFIL